MSDVTGPSLPDETPEPTAQAVPETAPAAPAAAAPAAVALPAWSSLDAPSRRIAGAGIATAIIGALGGVAGAWLFSWSGLILILAGVLAVAAAGMASGAARRTMPIAARDLALAGGTIAAALGVLFLAEIVFDIDDLESYGGLVGLVITIALAVAGIVLYIAASARWSGGAAAPWTTALAARDQSTRLVLLGAALVILGWLGNVTIGVWYLEAGSEVVTLVLLAALVVRAAADPEQPLRLPFPVAYVAVGLTAVGAIIAFQHTTSLLDEGVGIASWIPMLPYIAGVAVALAGSILAAIATMPRTPAVPAGSPPAPPTAPPTAGEQPTAGDQLG